MRGRAHRHACSAHALALTGYMRTAAHQLCLCARSCTPAAAAPAQLRSASYPTLAAVHCMLKRCAAASGIVIAAHNRASYLARRAQPRIITGSYHSTVDPYQFESNGCAHRLHGVHSCANAAARLAQATAACVRGAHTYTPIIIKCAAVRIVYTVCTAVRMERPDSRRRPPRACGALTRKLRLLLNVRLIRTMSRAAGVPPCRDYILVYILLPRTHRSREDR